MRSIVAVKSTIVAYLVRALPTDTVKEIPWQIITGGVVAPEFSDVVGAPHQEANNCENPKQYCSGPIQSDLPFKRCFYV